MEITFTLQSPTVYSIADLIRIFKAHVLSFIEYRTPAIIHCATTILDPLDHILDRFLNDIGISRIDALIHYNLAPLQTRRDMAALAIIHRAVIGRGPDHFRSFFQLDPNPPRHSSRLGRPIHKHQLLDPFEALHRDYINRSVLGYIWVYNLLPDEIVRSTSVKCFQSGLQRILKDMAGSYPDRWANLFTVRQTRNNCLLRCY